MMELIEGAEFQTYTCRIGNKRLPDRRFSCDSDKEKSRIPQLQNPKPTTIKTEEIGDAELA